MNAFNPLPTGQALLEVRDLSVILHTPRIAISVVRQVGYTLHKGRTLAIVGESGSGKTVMSLAPLGLLSAGVAAEMTGSVIFRGRNLLTANEAEMRTIRGADIGVIFQDPLSALNPSRRIGRQVAEVCEHHRGLDRKAADERALELLDLVGIADAWVRLRQFPHELSGGMRQRVMIAIAVAAEPSLLIADEPTTALDVTIQAQIIELLKDVQKRLGMAIVLITHDIGVVAGMADDIAVMYAGSIVELGSARDVLTAPRHPYTRGLLASIPRPSDPVGSDFRGLPGMPPDLLSRAHGCAFAPRCPIALAACDNERPMLKFHLPQSGHASACFLNGGQI